MPDAVRDSGTSIEPARLAALAREALAEDAPSGDRTSELVVPADVRCTAELEVKSEGVLAGSAAAEAVLDEAARQDGVRLTVSWQAKDGDRVGPGGVVARVEGLARTVLRAERPAINLLAHLSGVATLTRTFVDAATPASVLCTRKTTTGLRDLEREAVVAGGGVLHRASLSDAVLIKDNHLRVAGAVGEGVRRALEGGVPVEVEVETLEQLEEALAAGAERILLDNPTSELVRKAIDRVGDPERLEISGGVTLASIRGFVEAGARVISVGRLTHSAPALDISLEIVDVYVDDADG